MARQQNSDKTAETGQTSEKRTKLEKTDKTPEKLQRFQVFKNGELEFHTRRINQANELVDALKAQNVETVVFKDTKDGETVTHTKDRYSKNYRVRRSVK